jgi:hypothetical protein
LIKGEITQLEVHMNYLTRPLGAVLIALLASGALLAQERSQADVQVRSMAVVEAAGNLTCKFEVFSFNDDDARNTTVRVLFPVAVKFVSSATGCVSSPAMPDGTNAFAICDIGRLRVGESRTVQIVTTVPRIPRISKTFGAFAWSETPDPRPRNNYGEATAR